MQLEKKWEEFILKKKIKEYYIERVCEVFEMWLVLRLTFVVTTFNLKLNAVKVKLQLSMNGGQQIMGSTRFRINIPHLCQLSEYFKWIKWMCWTFSSSTSWEESGPMGLRDGCVTVRGAEGKEEAESTQLTAMSHQGTRISSLTKAHRHQRDGVGVGRGGTRRRSANTPPQHSADSLFQTWQLVLFFWGAAHTPSLVNCGQGPRTMWLTVITVFVKPGSGIFHNSPSYSWKWSWDTWRDTRGWIGQEVYG